MTNPRIPFQMSSERPKIAPPDGKPLIVQIVVNVEYWPFDQTMPRQALTHPHGADPKPDIPNYSWMEYGLRCGMPRLLKLFADRKLPVSVNLNASVIEQYPSLAAAMRDAGWNFQGHGMFQRILHKEDDEEGVIKAVVEKITDFTGTHPRGWMGPGYAETFDSPDYLKAAGVDYILDWVLDDLPCWVTTKHGPLLSLPYGFELNDAMLFAVEKQSSGEVLQRFKDTLRTFDDELADQPRVLTLATHPHQCAVPHRFPYYADIVDLLMARDDTIFMTGNEITDWYASEVPPEA